MNMPRKAKKGLALFLVFAIIVIIYIIVTSSNKKKDDTSSSGSNKKKDDTSSSSKNGSSITCKSIDDKKAGGQFCDDRVEYIMNKGFKGTAEQKAKWGEYNTIAKARAAIEKEYPDCKYNGCIGPPSCMNVNYTPSPAPTALQSNCSDRVKWVLNKAKNGTAAEKAEYPYETEAKARAFVQTKYPKLCNYTGCTT